MQNFWIFTPNTPHFSRKTRSLDPTFGNSCGTYPPKKLSAPPGECTLTVCRKASSSSLQNWGKYSTTSIGHMTIINSSFILETCKSSCNGCILNNLVCCRLYQWQQQSGVLLEMPEQLSLQCLPVSLLKTGASLDHGTRRKKLWLEDRAYMLSAFTKLLYLHLPLQNWRQLFRSNHVECQISCIPTLRLYPELRHKWKFNTFSKVKT